MDAGRGKELEENGFGVVLDKKRARPRGPALVGYSCSPAGSQWIRPGRVSWSRSLRAGS